MSDHNYIRARVNDLWSVDIPTFSKEVEAAFPGKAFIVRAINTDVVVSFTDTLTAPEVTTLDGVVSAHAGEDPPVVGGPHLEKEYDQNKRLIRETSFAKAEEDGTFSIKLEETLYTWQGVKLLSSVYKTYRNDVETSSLTTTYSTEQVTGNTIIREKRV